MPGSPCAQANLSGNRCLRKNPKRIVSCNHFRHQVFHLPTSGCTFTDGTFKRFVRIQSACSARECLANTGNARVFYWFAIFVSDRSLTKRSFFPSPQTAFSKCPRRTASRSGRRCLGNRFIQRCSARFQFIPARRSCGYVRGPQHVPFLTEIRFAHPADARPWYSGCACTGGCAWAHRFSRDVPARGPSFSYMPS